LCADRREDRLDARESSEIARFKSSLLSWYAGARRDLPWRRTRDPYAVWISETMLQQTRVETVVPYYERFLRELPTVGSLAEASEEKVLSLWSGLGYYRRARMLHAAAKRVAGDHGGAIPRDAEALRALEGVGAYTAGAIASIAYGKRAAVVDGNVLRVLARLFAIEEDVKTARGNARVWRVAEDLVKQGAGEPGDWNQALMELGATVCVPRHPRCEACPVREHCAGRARGIAADLPRKAAKRAPSIMARGTIVLASERGVLLARRRGDVLFGGLWEPPSTTGDIADLAVRLGVRVADLEPAGRVVHILSHRILQVDVLRGALGSGRRRSAPGEEYDAVETVAWQKVQERAQASLTRKILKVANVGPRGVPYEIK
jgi:A/G-specific adenine glycosylase